MDGGGQADAAPQGDADASPTTGSRRSPRHCSPTECRSLLPVGPGMAVLARRDVWAALVFGSFPGPGSLHMKQDTFGLLGTRFLAQQSALGAHWAAWPRRGLGELPTWLERWGAEETMPPAQAPGRGPDTKSQPTGSCDNTANSSLGAEGGGCWLGAQSNTWWCPDTRPSPPPTLLTCSRGGKPSFFVPHTIGVWRCTLQSRWHPRPANYSHSQQPVASLTLRAELRRQGANLLPLLPPPHFSATSRKSIFNKRCCFQCSQSTSQGKPHQGRYHSKACPGRARADGITQQAAAEKQRGPIWHAPIPWAPGSRCPTQTWASHLLQNTQQGKDK